MLVRTPVFPRLRRLPVLLSLVFAGVAHGAAPAPTFTWDDASYANLWENGASWIGHVAPPPGTLSPVVFGGSGGLVTMFSAIDVRDLRINGGGYVFAPSSGEENSASMSIGSLKTAAADTKVTFSSNLKVYANGDSGGAGGFSSGELIVKDASWLVAQGANSIDGAAIHLKHYARMEIWADNATTGNSTVYFDGLEGGHGGILDLKGHSTVLGGLDSSNGGGLVHNYEAPLSVLTLDVASGGSHSYGSVIDGHVHLTKAGDGTQWLAGNNKYDGGTTLAGGVLAVASAGALGATGTISFEGGALQYGSRMATDYSARFSTADGQAFHIDTNGNNVSFAKALTSAGGSLTKSGRGTLVLNAVANYSGATTVNGGILELRRDNTLSRSSSVSLAAGAKLDVGASTQTLRRLNGSGDVALQDRGVVNLYTNDDSVFAGTFSGTGTINKDSEDMLTLSGRSSFRGKVNVERGELKVDGSLDAAEVTVDYAGGLSGNGSVGKLDLYGTLSPGNSPGMLTAGDTTLDGAHYIWDINDVNGAAGVGYDTLQVNGVLTLANGGSIHLVSLTPDNDPGNVYNFNARQNYSYTLVTASGGIVGYEDDAYWVDEGGFRNATYGGTWSVALDGNKLVLNYVAAPVPEPGTYAMLLGGLALVGMAARRRQQGARA